MRPNIEAGGVELTKIREYERLLPAAGALALQAGDMVRAAEIGNFLGEVARTRDQRIEGRSFLLPAEEVESLIPELTQQSKDDERLLEYKVELTATLGKVLAFTTLGEAYTPEALLR